MVLFKTVHWKVPKMVLFHRTLESYFLYKSNAIVILLQTVTRPRRRAAISPSRGRSVPAPRSLTRRCSSSSGASITSAISPDRSARTSRPLSNSPRRRSRSGSRTDATKLSGVRWRPICWPRRRRRRKWPWKCWSGTTGGSTARENCCDRRCSRHIITHTHTACPPGACPPPALETSDTRTQARARALTYLFYQRQSFTEEPKKQTGDLFTELPSSSSSSSKDWYQFCSYKNTIRILLFQNVWKMFLAKCSFFWLENSTWWWCRYRARGFNVTVRLALSRPSRFKILKSEENIDLSNVCWTPWVSRGIYSTCTCFHISVTCFCLMKALKRMKHNFISVSHILWDVISLCSQSKSMKLMSRDIVSPMESLKCVIIRHKTAKTSHNSTRNWLIHI